MAKSYPLHRRSVKMIESLPPATHKLLKDVGLSTIGSLVSHTDEQITALIRGQPKISEPRIITGYVREALNKFLDEIHKAASPDAQSGESQESAGSERSQLQERLDNTIIEMKRLEEDLQVCKNSKQQKQLQAELTALENQVDDMVNTLFPDQ